MAINIAVLGEEMQADSYFYNADGTPFSPSTAVNWIVRDFDQNLISSGIATQDSADPSHWSCGFTIPVNARPTTDNKYSIMWRAANSQSSQIYTEVFEVKGQLQFEPFEQAQLVFLGQNFTARLRTFEKPQTLSLRICNNVGRVMLSVNGLDKFNASQQGSSWVYSVLVNAADSTQSSYLNELSSVQTAAGIAGNTSVPYVTSGTPSQSSGINICYCYWNYTDSNNNQETIITEVYIANGTMIRLFNDMRRFLDRIRNDDSIPQLKLSDVDLAHFALQGMDKFNGTNPSNNGVWGLGNLPEQFYYWVKLAAYISFLDAQYLAEGMAAFDFNGQAVSLTVDQTRYLQAMSSKLEQEYNAGASTTKTAAIRSGRIGTIGGTFGPAALLVGRIPYGYLTAGMFPTLPFLG